MIDRPHILCVRVALDNPKYAGSFVPRGSAEVGILYARKVDFSSQGIWYYPFLSLCPMSVCGVCFLGSGNVILIT